MVHVHLLIKIIGGCRIGCDFMSLFFIIDEYTDIADEKGARVQAEIVMDALRNYTKPRPTGEWIGGEVTRQCWEYAIRTATPTSNAQKLLIDTFDHYTRCLVQQAMDRDNNNILEVSDYFEVRRGTIGAYPVFAIIGLHLNVPTEVMENDIITTLHSAAVDMICIDNDILSWNVEYVFFPSTSTAQ
jgi:Delta6-protoilludene synthase